MKKKQIKLEVPDEQSVFLAIACTLTIHKFAWELNKALGISLGETSGVTINESCFPMLKDESSLPNKSIFIIKNRIEAETLIQKLENIDFILKFQGDFNNENVKEVVNKVRGIPSVIAAIKIDPSKIKGVKLIQNT
ncbi:MAG: IPExxxVDY family protein [Bacteroidales bacterium]